MRQTLYTLCPIFCKPETAKNKIKSPNLKEREREELWSLPRVGLGWRQDRQGMDSFINGEVQASRAVTT